MPITASAAIDCRRTTHRRGPPQTDVLAVFGENRRRMVQGIEALGQPERELGEDGELERAQGGVDHVVEPGRLQHQRPQAVGVLVVDERPRRLVGEGRDQRVVVDAVAVA